jgi:hypothetical protein
MQLIHWDRGANRVQAASDPRGIGRADVIVAPVPAETTDDNTEEKP